MSVDRELPATSSYHSPSPRLTGSLPASAPLSPPPQSTGVWPHSAQRISSSSSRSSRSPPRPPSFDFPSVPPPAAELLSSESVSCCCSDDHPCPPACCCCCCWARRRGGRFRSLNTTAKNARKSLTTCVSARRWWIALNSGSSSTRTLGKTGDTATAKRPPPLPPTRRPVSDSPKTPASPILPPKLPPPTPLWPLLPLLPLSLFPLERRTPHSQCQCCTSRTPTMSSPPPW
mmetsp:Transcript_24785/g.50906  ORF Transcript_24785/g.50906 Transcript_24785/m.50906 type:complete len:231 (+) Transcript_24785:590-1282(+)